jgi:sec-independent protein translocase protein TatC
VQIKVAFFAAFFIAFPVIANQVWAFVAPGLYRKEKGKIVPFVICATLFFVAGTAFCYLVILGPAFEFLISSAGPDIKPMLMMDDQLGLVMTLVLAFGIIFELPLVLTFLAMLGIVDHKFLNKYRRHAVVVNVIIAAFITPTGDPFNLALMAAPMFICYELGVLGAWVFGKGRKEAKDAAAAKLAGK